MRRALVWVGIVALTACTAPAVQDAAGKFHDGYASSAKTLANRNAALVAFYRARASETLFTPVPVASSPRVSAFADYVCFQPVGTESLATGIASLGQLNQVTDPAGLKADDDLFAKVSGLASALHDYPGLKPTDPASPTTVDRCRSSVLRLMSLPADDLPVPKPPQQREQGYVFAPALIAAVALVKEAYTGLNLLLGKLEEEQKAKRLERLVADRDTQDRVRGAFAQLYGVDLSLNSTDPAIVTFCATPANQPVCAAASQPAADGRPSNQAAAAAAECSARPQNIYFDPSKIKTKTLLDAITITERWDNLQTAWRAYADFSAPGATTNQVRHERQVLLDQGVADYLATPSLSNVAGDMVQAWSTLSDMSYGCLTRGEAVSALEAFTKNADAVLTEASKISDAKDKLDSALAGPAASADK